VFFDFIKDFFAVNMLMSFGAVPLNLDRPHTQSHKLYFNNASNIIEFMWPHNHHHVDITHNVNLIMVI
jgi:hypothetical protein